MNSDAHKGKKSFFERKAEAKAQKGQPADHRPPVAPAPIAPPAPSRQQLGYYFSSGISAADMNASLQKLIAGSAAFTFTTDNRPDPQFAGKEFALGVARGARSFKVDGLGRLTGISYPQIWKPGENLSECRAVRPHSDGGFAEKCRCGFYGYYDGSNDYHTEGRVSGVIEGYGEAVLGSRGFRVTKARIVALTIADDVTGSLARLVRRNYADIPFFDTFTRMVSEFPPDYELDTTERPTPETDPDFWERPA